MSKCSVVNVCVCGVVEVEVSNELTVPPARSVVFIDSMALSRRFRAVSHTASRTC